MKNLVAHFVGRSTNSRVVVELDRDTFEFLFEKCVHVGGREHLRPVEHAVILVFHEQILLAEEGFVALQTLKALRGNLLQIADGAKKAA